MNYDLTKQKISFSACFIWLKTSSIFPEVFYFFVKIRFRRLKHNY